MKSKKQALTMAFIVGIIAAAFAAFPVAALFAQMGLEHGVDEFMRPVVPIIPFVIGALVGCIAMNFSGKAFIGQISNKQETQ